MGEEVVGNLLDRFLGDWGTKWNADAFLGLKGKVGYGAEQLERGVKDQDLVEVCQCRRQRPL